VEDIDWVSQEIEMAHAQALKYGQDLVRIFNQEKAKRQELELTNQKLRALWATAPNGLALLDEEMRVIEINPRFAALAELHSDCEGCHLTEIIPSPKLDEVLQKAAAQAEPFSDIEVSLDQPMQRTLQITGAPLAAGNQRGWVVSLHDLTERKRLEGLKEEFIDIAAHELRTPLAIILGFASVLSEDDLYQDEMTAAPLDAIIQAATRLRMIVNELVEFAATRDSARAIGSLDEFNVWELLGHSVGIVSQQAAEVGIEISLEKRSSHPITIYADRVIIAQAIGHILENAVTFNKPGGRVLVSASQTDTETTIRVEDTGIGIPATELDRVFEMFYQVEDHMTRVRGGMGMGLSIAKRGIELHGGSIHVTSTLDVGSCFIVTLPNRTDTIVISTQDRLDTAHKQTLAYGRDLARAFMAQRHLKQQVRELTQIGRQITNHLENMENIEDSLHPEAQQELEKVRRLAQTISSFAQRQKGTEQ
jgi:two-component system, OmpR family, phosphate regulon sensor histidine kinase PhoR